MSHTDESVVFLWENFGPTHVDRCEAAATQLRDVPVVGLEYQSTSDVYAWIPENGTGFRKVTRSGFWRRFDFLFPLWLVREVLRTRARHVFLCHYNELGVQVSALMLRALGRRLYLLIDSKFDDLPRVLWREILKALWIFPYRGGIAGSERSRKYLKLLGLKPSGIMPSYDTISVDRIRALAGSAPGPAGYPHAGRHFTIVARLVPKKNLFKAIEAFALYARSVVAPRSLRIFGNGELEEPLRAHAAKLGVDRRISFEGFRQTAEVCRALATSLALLLVSTEEQFGLVIIEAAAMGVPAIVSLNCGARDDFVRSGVNGFIVEPDNAEGMAFFMRRLSEDERLWTELAKGASDGAEKADARHFASGIAKLMQDDG